MAPQKLDILCYHAVTRDAPPLDDFCFMPVEKFRAHMKWLRASGYAVLPLKEAADALAAGTLQRRTVAVTFDDGFRNNVTVALPVLEQFQIPATIYLSTGLVGTASTTWAGRVTFALTQTEAQSLDFAGQAFSLRDSSERARANRDLQRQVKSIAAANPNAAVAEIEFKLGVSVNPNLTGNSNFEMLQKDDIARARASGLVDFGGHSVSHPILSALADDQLAQEVLGSVRSVEDLAQAPCESFAYPNGQPSDFDERTVELLRAAGVHTAVTTTQLVNRAGADPLRLSRWVLGGTVSVARLRATMMGLHPNQLRNCVRARFPARS